MAEFKILRKWEIQTTINCLLHSSASGYYSKLNMFFMIPIIILSSSTGTLGLMNTSSSQIVVMNNVNIISLLVGIFGFLSAMLTTIHNFLGIQKLQSTHSFHSVEYNKISREIKMHIYLSETDVKVYANIVEYIKQCRAKIDKLIETAPEIPHHIEEQLQPKIKLIEIEDNNELNDIITLSNSRSSMCLRGEDMTIRRQSNYENEDQQETHIVSNCLETEQIALRIFLTNENIKHSQDIISEESPSSETIHSRHSFDEPSGISTLRENSLSKMKDFFSSSSEDINNGK
jgi:hypothetical protein